MASKKKLDFIEGEQYWLFRGIHYQVRARGKVVKVEQVSDDPNDDLISVQFQAGKTLFTRRTLIELQNPNRHDS